MSELSETILCPLLSMTPCRDECAHRIGGRYAEMVKAEALQGIEQQLAVLARTAQEQLALDKSVVEDDGIQADAGLTKMLELMAEDGVVGSESAVRTCRICGCTDDHACEGGCYWVEDDLCSSCVVEFQGYRVRFVFGDTRELFCEVYLQGEIGGAKETIAAAWEWLRLLEIVGPCSGGVPDEIVRVDWRPNDTVPLRRDVGECYIPETQLDAYSNAELVAKFRVPAEETTGPERPDAPPF